MAEAMLGLAAVGVDVLRIDAAPFLWKRLGTNCQNQPEVHELLGAFRAALRIAAPAVALKAEAIVAPRDLVPYLRRVRPRLPQRADGAAVERAGVGPRGADDGDAEGDAAGPAGRGLADLRALPRRHRLGDHARGRRAASARTTTCTGASWPTSTRASSRHVRARRALPARPAHRRGAHVGIRAPRWPAWSPRPTTVAVELAVRRILLLYAVAFAHGGLPLIYMGDELGLLNDASYLDEPDRRDDNRWMHRPPMDWEAAERRDDPRRSRAGCGRACGGWSRPAARPARSTSRASSEPIWTGNEHVFGLCREQAGERLLVLANFTAHAAGRRARRGARPRLPADRGGGRGRRAPDRGLPRLHRAGALPAPVAPRRFPGFRGTLSSDEQTTSTAARRWPASAP